MSRNAATLIGFSAVVSWALLALLTVASSPVPPLLLNALCFAIGGMAGMVWLLVRGGLRHLRGVPASVYLFGTLGLAGYHLLYFAALRMAPPAAAGLIAYLWPLLIVLGSGLLPGERLRPGHLLGALMAFGGAALLITQGMEETGSIWGYALALMAAFVWAGYSLGSRLLGAQPTATVAVYCLCAAVLSAVAHLAFETPAWPEDWLGWAAIICLGLGPVGLAFFAWDVGVKRGDIQLLGTASYAAPLLSTMVLVLAGVAPAAWALALSTLLITGGAALAAHAGRRARISLPKGG